MASRRKAREIAMQMLFQWEVGEHQPHQIIATFLRFQNLDSEVERFARGLFEGTVAEAPALDERIRAQSKNWRLERMAAVDRNVLRVALYELLHFPDTPPAVVINESLEIVRRFSGVDSVDFVNGVLDGIRKNLEAKASPEPPAPAAEEKISSPKQAASRSKGAREK